MLSHICQAFKIAFDKRVSQWSFLLKSVCTWAVVGRESYGCVDGSLDTVFGGLLLGHSGSHDYKYLQRFVPSDFLIKSFSQGQQSSAEGGVKCTSPLPSDPWGKGQNLGPWVTTTVARRGICK